MYKLGSSCGSTKIDLADVFNQIPLGPVSRKKLALNTHKGVLLCMRLPLDIILAPGYVLRNNGTT